MCSVLPPNNIRNMDPSGLQAESYYSARLYDSRYFHQNEYKAKFRGGLIAILGEWKLLSRRGNKKMRRRQHSHQVRARQRDRERKTGRRDIAAA